MLEFCIEGGMDCTATTSDPITVERMSDIIIKHSITTAEFTNYHMKFIGMKIGEFVPNVLEIDGSN